MIDPLAERPWKGVSFLVLDPAGVRVEPDGLVDVPYRQSDGSVFRRRFIAPDGRTWWGPGEGLIPLGLETLPDPLAARRCAVILAEGESDTFALREAFADVTPASRVRGYYVLGIPGASTWRPEWRQHVEAFPVVYVIGDGDDAGRELNATVKRDIPWARPVWLPDGEDARSMLHRDGLRALDMLLATADATARRVAAFILAHDLSEFRKLLAQAEVRDGA